MVSSAGSGSQWGSHFEALNAVTGNATSLIEPETICLEGTSHARLAIKTRRRETYGDLLQITVLLLLYLKDA